MSKSIQLKETPDQVAAPSFKEQALGKVAISHGFDGDDFVIHFSTINAKINFKASDKNLLMKVIEVLRGTVPDGCRVDIWTPLNDWDLKMYTVKAWGLKNYWQITDKVLDEVIKKLFLTLNTLV